MHVSFYNMATTSSDLSVPNTGPWEILKWATAHVSSSDSESEFGNSTPVNTDDDNDDGAECIFCGGFPSQDNMGNSRPNAQSAKGGVIVTALLFLT
jgi:hypothetical protein